MTFSYRSLISFMQVLTLRMALSQRLGCRRSSRCSHGRPAAAPSRPRTRRQRRCRPVASVARKRHSRQPSSMRSRHTLRPCRLLAPAALQRGQIPTVRRLCCQTACCISTACGASAEAGDWCACRRLRRRWQRQQEAAQRPTGMCWPPARTASCGWSTARRATRCASVHVACERSSNRAAGIPSCVVHHNLVLPCHQATWRGPHLCCIFATFVLHFCRLQSSRWACRRSPPSPCCRPHLRAAPAWLSLGLLTAR